MSDADPDKFKTTHTKLKKKNIATRSKCKMKSSNGQIEKDRVRDRRENQNDPHSSFNILI